MVGLINLEHWKTKSEIIKELREKGVRTNERHWRLYVEWHNKQFCDGIFNDYIAHSPKGYKLTSDPNEISKSASDLRARALNLLKKSSEAQRAIERINQERMEV